MDFNATGTQPILYKSGAINIRADGYLEALNIKARGDVRGDDSESQYVMVEHRANIGGNAVTIPSSAEGCIRPDGSSPSNQQQPSSNDLGRPD